MSEQRHLFAQQRQRWIEAVWSSVPAETRREVLAILADMGRSALGSRSRDREEVKRDESE